MVAEPQIFRDDRGFFFESYHKLKFKQGGVDAVFVQDNHSRSAKGTLRGLHMQLVHPQGKLVRVLAGEIFDVVVDIRAGSPTFKKWVAVTLSDKDFKAIYVPPGFAHGFLTLSEVADVEYKCTDFYDKADEAGIIWNDPAIGIKWPSSKPLLSPKDQAYPVLEQVLPSLSNYPAYRA